jgi:hypothetical protein
MIYQNIEYSYSINILVSICIAKAIQDIYNDIQDGVREFIHGSPPSVPHPTAPSAIATPLCLCLCFTNPPICLHNILSPCIHIHHPACRAGIGHIFVQDLLCLLESVLLKNEGLDVGLVKSFGGDQVDSLMLTPEWRRGS